MCRSPSISPSSAPRCSRSASSGLSPTALCRQSSLSPMSRPLKVLIVEDDDNDLQLLLLRLREDGYEPDYECVQTAEAMASALVRRQDWEIVLSDYRLPN